MQPPSPAVTPRSEASRLRRVRLRMCVLAPVVAAALMLLPVASRADSVCAYSPPGDTLDATAPSASFPTGPSGASLPGRRDMFKASRDLFTVDVAPRFSASSDPASVSVRFAVRTDWDKEVVARNLCNGSDLGRLFARGRTTNPSTLTVRRSSGNSGVDTLVMRKPGFFGVWIDSSYFEPSSFWSAYGGRSITVTWWSD